MQLCRLRECTLMKGTKTKANNGTYTTSYNEVKSYKVIPQELQDQVSASIYGANINKTLRLSSVRKQLESFLYTKLNNQEDNISNYVINYNNTIYKIVSVKSNWVDIEAIGEYRA